MVRFTDFDSPYKPIVAGAWQYGSVAGFRDVSIEQYVQIPSMGVDKAMNILANLFSKAYKLFTTQPNSVSGYISADSPASPPFDKRAGSFQDYEGAYGSTKGAYGGIIDANGIIIKSTEADASVFQSIDKFPTLFAFENFACSKPGACKLTRKNSMTINGVWKEGESVVGAGALTASIQFYAWADHNHMPLKRVTVNWGDGASQGGGQKGNYQNQKPVCSTVFAPARVCVAYKYVLSKQIVKNHIPTSSIRFFRKSVCYLIDQVKREIPANRPTICDNYG